MDTSGQRPWRAVYAAPTGDPWYLLTGSPSTSPPHSVGTATYLGDPAALVPTLHRLESDLHRAPQQWLAQRLCVTAASAGRYVRGETAPDPVTMPLAGWEWLVCRVARLVATHGSHVTDSTAGRNRA
jgi:hypothetical protein